MNFYDYSNIFYILKNILNISTVSILITLAIYHLIIYFGRRKGLNETYNIYFAIFSFFCSLNVILSTSDLIFYINKNISTKIGPIYRIIGPSLDVIFSACAVYGAINCFAVLFNFPKTKMKKFYPAYLFMTLSFIFTLSNIIFGQKLYYKNFYIFSLITFLIGLIFMFIIFIYWILKQKYYKLKTLKIVSIGFLILVTSIFLQRLFLINRINKIIFENFYNLYHFLYFNQFLLGISILVFAYALAQKFNHEHHELSFLKKNLEEKITERTNELMTAYKTIQKSNKQRINYFINISHETKTPLTLISNYLQKFVKNKKNHSEELDIIIKNLKKLENDMINFLDIEKFENGQFIYNHNKISNLSKILYDKIILFDELASKKNIKINSIIDKDIYIKIDPTAADRIINNLIENAIRYSYDPGKIDIILKVNNNRVEFRIKDDGIGISEENQNNIFNPFFQVFNKKNQGIGMGLHIVKKIIDEINGEIIVNSKEKLGTEFIVILQKYNLKQSNENIVNYNVTKPLNYYLSEKKLKSEFIDESKHNILCIEDNIELLSYIQDELLIKYNFFYATNGKEALYKLTNIPKPDIIISDIIMENMNGFEFYDKLKNNSNFNDIPFIFLTAVTDKNEKLKGLKKGAIDFINKPFMIEELEAKINSIIKNKKTSKNLSKIEIETKILNVLRSENKKIYKKDDFSNVYIKYNITKREQDIIENILKGYENKEIADKLYISLSTVKKHINNIYKKLNVMNKIELINFLKMNTYNDQ